VVIAGAFYRAIAGPGAENLAQMGCSIGGNGLHLVTAERVKKAGP